MSPNLILLLCVIYLSTQITNSLKTNEEIVGNAAGILSDIFADMKNYGLGASHLQREYSSTDITYSEITNPRTTLTSMTKPEMTLQRIISVMNAITANTSSINTVENCCSSSNSQATSPCCQRCDEAIPIEVETAADAIKTAGLNDLDVEMSVGYYNGMVLTYPHPPLDQCEGIDARLKPWYNAVTQTKSKELVIFLDLNERDLTGNSSRTQLREAALNVIQSLSPDVKVGLVIADNINKGECPKVLMSATPQIKAELIRIIEEQVLSGNRNYPNDFETAREYFSTDLSLSDKMLLLLTNGLVGISTESLIDFQEKNTGNDFNAFKFRIYTANTPAMGNEMFNFLEQQTNGLGSLPLSNIAGYAQDDISPTDRVYLTTDTNRNEELCLSVSKTWIDEDSDLVGVINALLPWRSLMNEIEDSLLPRVSSYYFILSQNGTMFYHSMFDDMNVVDINSFTLETEPEFASHIHSVITSGSHVEESVTIQKTIINHQSGDYGLINRIIPTTYTCQQVIGINDTVAINDGVIHACIVLAAEDTSVLDSFTIPDIAAVYRSSSISQLPLYHTQLSDSSDVCNSFCLVSVEDRISLQLTSPLATPTSSADEISSYLSGTGMRPDDVEEGVAEEVAVVSAVGEAWLNNRRMSVTLPIKRRHLATPTGIYLSYPAIQLNASFVPQYLPWYKSAISNRGILSLSAARTDELDGVGSVYTASYPVVNDNDVLLSVLAADASESSLRLQVLNNVEKCHGSTDYDCSIINNRGDFILHPANEGSSNAFDSNKYFEIMRILHRNGSLINLGCRDQSDPDISYRLYYKLLDDLPTMCFDSSGTEDDCFCISSIRGTDSYLLVVNNNCELSGLRFCPLFCDKCTITQFGCPCSCKEGICEDSISNIDVPICPLTTPPSDYEYVSNLAIATSTISQCQEDDCCGHNSSNCELSPHCNWCSTHSICLPLATCCSSMGKIGCCDNINPTCLTRYCAREQGKEVCLIPVTTPTVSSTTSDSDSSSIDRQGAIIGGVIGGVFGILLLGLLIVCCVWYQVCRPDTNEEQTKPKSDFNFTDIKVASVNKTAIELKGVESLPENGEKPTTGNHEISV